MGLHTAIETSGFLGDRVDDRFLSVLDLVLLSFAHSQDPMQTLEVILPLGVFAPLAAL